MAKFEEIVEDIKKYKAVIFDFDGTLVDLGINWKCLKKELNAFCLKAKKDNIEFTKINDGLNYAKNKYGQGFYQNLVKIVSKYELNEENYKISNAALDFIKDTNQTIIIYSMNTRESIDNFFKKFLLPKPSLIISKENSLKIKPTGLDLQRIIGILKLKRNDVVFVGNSKEDYLSGKSSRIMTFIVKI